MTILFLFQVKKGVTGTILSLLSIDHYRINLSLGSQYVICFEVFITHPTTYRAIINGPLIPDTFQTYLVAFIDLKITSNMSFETFEMKVSLKNYYSNHAQLRRKRKEPKNI